LQVDVTGNDGNRGDVNVWRPQSHDQRDSVIGRCIGIDQKRASHARSIADPEIFSVRSR
jgi:hypothetical protein